MDVTYGLLPQHAAMLEASAITPEVAQARGYRSVEQRAHLIELGFSPTQARVPALLLPVWGVAGEVVMHQIRPDKPRMNSRGKAVKYETPRGSRMVLDAHPAIRSSLGDPGVPLWITEGLRKADAAVSVGLSCIALLGVWNWRGTNEHGGTVALPDFESIALNGRDIYLAFDSDASTKPAVHQALARLKSFLQSRRGHVRLVHLPAGPGWAKVGLDDFLAAGHGVDDLLGLATTELLRAARVTVHERQPAEMSLRGESASARLTKRSTADHIVELANDRYDLARAEDGEPFAIDRVGPNVARLFRGGRAALRAALAASFAEEFGKVPPAQALIDALAVLEGRALRLPRQALPLRSARLDDGSVVIDLGDESGRTIMVEPDGWRVLPRSPITFRRSELIAALPEPASGDVSDLLRLLNIAPDDRPLILAHLVGALLGISVPIILFRGPAGAAKTSAARALARTIDPSPAPVRAVPRDPESWAVTAGGSCVVVLDNIDTVPAWLSDALCRAVTGEGYLRRALYTDSAISVVAFRRAIILTGIDPGAMRGDLADRLLAIDLTEIDERDRQEEAEVEAAFVAAHPAILGSILDLAAAVLRAMPSIQLARRPRLADYGRVLAAVDAILGTNGLDRYLAQRSDLQREAAEGDPIGSAVIAWMEHRTDWTGTATALLEAITPERRPKDWPKSPRGLSGALRRVAQPLKAAGILPTFSQEGHDKRRIIHLEREGVQPSAPSAGPVLSVPRADDADDADGTSLAIPWRDVAAPVEPAGLVDSIEAPVYEADVPVSDDWEAI